MAYPENPRPQKSSDMVHTSPAGWMAGLSLIVIGLVFLLQMQGALPSNFNWWALFILIPALGFFGQAWREYQRAGIPTAGFRNLLVGGLSATLVAIIFLFGLDWGRVWPLFVILAGIGALLSSALGRAEA